MSYQTQREADLQILCKEVEEGLHAIYGVRMGFFLLSCPFYGANFASDYVSNIAREDAIKTLRKCADRLERGEDLQ